MSIGEQSAVANSESVAREAEARAKGLKLAGAALSVVTGGLSPSTKHELFAGIRHRLGEEAEGQTDLELLHGLLKANDVVTAQGEQEADIAKSALESAEHVRQHGLPL